MQIARTAAAILAAGSSSSLNVRSVRPLAVAAFALSPAPTTQNQRFSSSCKAATGTSTVTMVPEADKVVDASSLPRWDLSKFGFSSPFSDDINGHLDETRKLAEGFKVRGKICPAAKCMLIHFRI